MNIKSVQEIAQDIGWWPNQKKVAEFLGVSRQNAAKFLSDNGIPHHRITEKTKSYFLDDIIKAVEETKHK